MENYLLNLFGISYEWYLSLQAGNKLKLIDPWEEIRSNKNKFLFCLALLVH